MAFVLTIFKQKVILKNDEHDKDKRKAAGKKRQLKNLLFFFSRMIASSVRRISRSFYSASNETLNTSHHRTGSFAEISGVTRQSVVARKIANNKRFNQTSQSDSDLPELEKKVVEPIVTTPPSSSPSSSTPSCQESSNATVSKKLSKINLRKLKIW